MFACTHNTSMKLGIWRCGWYETHLGAVISDFTKTPQHLLCLCSVHLTGLQAIHVLQPDDVSFVEAELGPVLRDVIPHRHHILGVLTKRRCADTDIYCAHGLNSLQFNGKQNSKNENKKKVRWHFYNNLWWNSGWNSGTHWCLQDYMDLWFCPLNPFTHWSLWWPTVF